MSNENKISVALRMRNIAMAICFCLALAGLFVGTSFNMYEERAEIVKTIRLSDTLKNAVNNLNLAVDENVFEKFEWISLYGLANRIMMKREIDNYVVVKVTDKQLHLTQPEKNVFANERLDAQLKNLGQLYEYTQDRGYKFLLAEAPDKSLTKEAKMPPGVHSDLGKYKDLFLSKAAAAGIPNIDSMDSLGTMSIDEAFAKTDHHWRTPFVMKTYFDIMAFFRSEYGIDLDPENKYTDISNYKKITFPGQLGSAGVKVGKWYVGTDSLIVYKPKYKTDFIYEYYMGSDKIHIRKGPFMKTLVSKKRTAPGYYAKYSAFIPGDHDRAKVINNLASNNLKAIFISDSFGWGIAPYLSQSFAEMLYLNPRPGRFYAKDWRKVIDGYVPDIIIVMPCAQNIWTDIPMGS